MSYLNAKEVFPPEILEIIQEYVQGACVYIPRRENDKRRSERAGANELRERNAEIRKAYAEGVSVRRLSEKYFLSPQAIYKILAGERK